MGLTNVSRSTNGEFVRSALGVRSLAGWKRVYLEDGLIYVTSADVSDSGKYIVLGSYKLSDDFTGYVYLSSDYGKTWGRTSEIINASDVKISASGQYIFIKEAYYIHVSNDYGETWSTNPFEKPIIHWGISSEDGQHVYAVCQGTSQYNHYMFSSHDFGITWQQNFWKRPNGDPFPFPYFTYFDIYGQPLHSSIFEYYDFKVSGDGSKIILTGQASGMAAPIGNAISDCNYGNGDPNDNNYWILATRPTDFNPYGYGIRPVTYCDISKDGSCMAFHTYAVPERDGNLWVSRDDGHTWYTNIFLPDDTLYFHERRQIYLSDNGEVQVFSPYSGGWYDPIYLSSDYGVTWASIDNFNNFVYSPLRKIALSNNGERVSLVNMGKKLVASEDFGVNFKTNSQCFFKTKDDGSVPAFINMSANGKNQIYIQNFSTYDPYLNNIFINLNYGKGGYN